MSVAYYTKISVSYDTFFNCYILLRSTNTLLILRYFKRVIIITYLYYENLSSISRNK